MSTERDQVSNLVFHYTERVDSGDFAGIGALFAHGSVECFIDGASNGGRRTGAEAIMSWYKSSMSIYDGSPRTRHVITNLIIDVAPDEMSARTRSYFLVLQSLADFPLQIVAAGRYHDAFEKENGVWRFVEKIIHADHFGDISRHYPPLAGTSGRQPVSDIPLVGNRD